MRRNHGPWGEISSDEDDDRAKLLQDHGSVQTYSAIEAHESGLERLGEALRRQKDAANSLATEVDIHNEILDDIDSGVDNTNVQLQKNTRNIKLVTKKASTCLLWIIILLLGVVIVTLAII